MISRGLLISIGITILAVGLVFVYFRNKVSGMEKKVELMFNLIQNYDGQQNARDIVSDPRMNPDEIYPTEQTIKSELIQISEDEDNSDSDEVSDSDEESDEESDDEEETLKFEPTNIELNDDEVKTINLEEIKHETYEDSLDEINDDDDDLDEITLEPQEIKPDPQEETDDEPLEAVEVIQLSANSYKKKTVVELKKIAYERGLINYKSLKKEPLIQLLMSN